MMIMQKTLLAGLFLCSVAACGDQASLLRSIARRNSRRLGGGELSDDTDTLSDLSGGSRSYSSAVFKTADAADANQVTKPPSAKSRHSSVCSSQRAATPSPATSQHSVLSKSFEEHAESKSAQSKRSYACSSPDSEVDIPGCPEVPQIPNLVRHNSIDFGLTTMDAPAITDAKGSMNIDKAIFGGYAIKTREEREKCIMKVKELVESGVELTVEDKDFLKSLEDLTKRLVKKEQDEDQNEAKAVKCTKNRAIKAAKWTASAFTVAGVAFEVVGLVQQLYLKHAVVFQNQWMWYVLGGILILSGLAWWKLYCICRT